MEFLKKQWVYSPKSVKGFAVATAIMAVLGLSLDPMYYEGNPLLPVVVTLVRISYYIVAILGWVAWADMRQTNLVLFGREHLGTRAMLETWLSFSLMLVITFITLLIVVSQ